jgi:hypothetical protein
MVTVTSIYRRLIKLAIASHPVDGPSVKVREPAARFVRRPKAPRARTEAELAGLRKGNARRHVEAEARRSAAKEAEAAT